MGLNTKQVEQLLRPVNPKRVQRDNKGMSHLAGYDVSAHLTRIFGFGGWEKKIRCLELVCEEGVKSGDGKRTGWYVTYRCQMTLIVKDPSGEVFWSNDEAATGSASNLPQRGDAHDFALKNAVTYALKRCAKDLGDQFGLSLYNAGSMKPIVGQVLTEVGAGDVEDTIPDDLHPDTDTQESPVPQNGQQPRQEPGPQDSLAQQHANAAAKCVSPAGVQQIRAEAEQDHTLGEQVADPENGVKGLLKAYLDYLERSFDKKPVGAANGHGGAS